MELHGRKTAAIPPYTSTELEVRVFDISEG